MESDAIKELIKAAERYYDSSVAMRTASEMLCAAQSRGDLHQIVDAQCLLASQKGETLRAAGSLLHAVEAYRAGWLSTVLGG